MNFIECLKVYGTNVYVSVCTCVYSSTPAILFSPSVGNAQEKKDAWSNSLENML